MGAAEPTPENVAEALAAGRTDPSKSKAFVNDTSTLGDCPSCGSPNFFSRAFSEGGTPLRNPPMPQCHDCGYPLVQSGSGGGSLTAVRAGGPARAAAQPVYGNPADYGY